MPNNNQNQKRGRRKNRQNGKNMRGQGATRIGASSALMDVRVNPPLFPVMVRKKMFYYDYGRELTSTAAAVAYYRFTANGLYDPDITSAGHQPLGFDTMMTYYEQFTVVASKITCCFVNSTAAVGMRASISLSPDTANYTNTTDIVENGLIATRMICGSTGGGMHQMATLNLGCDVPKYFGRSPGRAILDDVNLYGTIAGNPTEQVYYVIAAWNATNTTTCTLGFDTIVEYDAYFWEPKKAVQQ